MNEALKNAVFESLNTAVDENGSTELLAWPVTDIVADMLSFDPSLEQFPDLNMVELFTHVNAWLASRGV